MARDSMSYDVVIVGGGPSGLAAAIRLKQLAAEAGRDTSVSVLEKGSEIGAHILSGAVLEPRALDELIPDWKDKDAPLRTPVAAEKFLFLTERNAFSWPTSLLPPVMHNRGNYVISLGNFCRWLAGQAEGLGVEIYPGFAAAEILYDEKGAVGRRYRRQDEAGTPFCVTVDGQTLVDQTVTIRDRDTLRQIRIAADKVVTYVKDRLELQAGK